MKSKILVISLLVFTLLAGAGYLAYSKNNSSGNANVNTTTANSSNTALTTSVDQALPTTCPPSYKSPWDEEFSPDDPVNPSEKCFMVQVMQVHELRIALDAYKNSIQPGNGLFTGTGKYPPSLNDIAPELKRQRDVCKEADAAQFKKNNEAGLGLPCPTYDTVLESLTNIDAYTQQPYIYTSKSDDYEVRFVVRYYEGMDTQAKSNYQDGENVVVAKDGNLLYGTYTGTIPTSETGRLAVDTDKDFLTDDIERNLSKTDPTKVDTDSDGLTDYEEHSGYRTDPQKADSDGDGYKDGEEVCGGFNPLGSGKYDDNPLPFKPESCR